jgi:hypothetical protein
MRSDPAPKPEFEAALNSTACNGITNPIWTYVAGQWDVPTLTTPPILGVGFVVWQWIGLGGTTLTSPLPQEGTIASVSCYIDGSSCVYSYHAWQYYFCDDSQPEPTYIPTITVRAGDHMAASFSMVDTNGNPNKNGPSALMNICDSSYSPYVCNNNIRVNMPVGHSCNGGAYIGEAADWVFERYGRTRLANFGNSYMQYNFAKMADRNSSQPCFAERSLLSSGAEYTHWTLWGNQNCGGNLMAQSWIIAQQTHGAEILMAYINYQ